MFIYQVRYNFSQVWQKGPYEKELQIQYKWFWWVIIRDINKKAYTMGQQEAYYFRFRISGNSHYKPQQEAVHMVYFLQ